MYVPRVALCIFLARATGAPPDRDSRGRDGPNFEACFAPQEDIEAGAERTYPQRRGCKRPDLGRFTKPRWAWGAAFSRARTSLGRISRVVSSCPPIEPTPATLSPGITAIAKQPCWRLRLPVNCRPCEASFSTLRTVGGNWPISRVLLRRRCGGRQRRHYFSGAEVRGLGVGSAGLSASRRYR
jgi:hypothetical protein